MPDQTDSAYLSNHVKKAVFPVKGQVVLHKSFSSSFVIYLDTIFIQLQKAIKTQAHWEVNGTIFQRLLVYPCRTLELLTWEPVLSFLSFSDRETLDENVPRSYCKLAFTSREAVDGTALVKDKQRVESKREPWVPNQTSKRKRKVE